MVLHELGGAGRREHELGGEEPRALVQVQVSSFVFFLFEFWVLEQTWEVSGQVLVWEAGAV